MKSYEEIKKELEDLDAKQLCQFAWLYGVRALPFLSVDRNFSYWSADDKQKHLYSIFNALDVSAQFLFLNKFSSADIRAACDAADKVAKTARAADVAAAYVAAAYAITANKVLNATARVATAIATYDDANKNFHTAARVAAATRDYNNAAKVADAAYDISTVATKDYADAVKAYTDAIAENLAIDSILLEDINAIRDNKLNLCSHDVSIYVELWDSFLEDLKNNGCGYWAKLYEDLFENGFDKLDLKELERRVNVPNEIKYKGAVEVGRHLENKD